MLLLLEFRWEKANQTAAERQTELEACADRLGSFASAANQLSPWLREKELMMSVLGPLSIDPNMLNTQKQQVQVYARVHTLFRALSRVNLSYVELFVDIYCNMTRFQNIRRFQAIFFMSYSDSRTDLKKPASVAYEKELESKYYN